MPGIREEVAGFCCRVWHCTTCLWARTIKITRKTGFFHQIVVLSLFVSLSFVVQRGGGFSVEWEPGAEAVSSMDRLAEWCIVDFSTRKSESPGDAKLFVDIGYTEAETLLPDGAEWNNLTGAKMAISPFTIMRLDGAGGGCHIELEEACLCLKQKSGVLWIRLNYRQPEAADWLEHSGFFDPVVVESLQDENSRPRSTLLEEGLLLSLRGVNLNEGNDPEEMIALMMWCEEHLVLTSRDQHLKAFADLEHALLQGHGPKTISQFLSTLIDQLTDATDQVLDRLEDDLELLENNLEQEVESDSRLRERILLVRQISVRLKRFLAPQREALAHLLSSSPRWLKKRDKILVQENINQHNRFLDDLLFASDRARLTQDELYNLEAEKMNRRMFGLTMAATLFLPLSFLTGLFGVNVGGIPWGESRSGFLFFCLCLVLFAACQFCYFKWKKWF